MFDNLYKAWFSIDSGDIQYSHYMAYEHYGILIFNGVIFNLFSIGFRLLDLLCTRIEQRRLGTKVSDLPSVDLDTPLILKEKSRWYLGVHYVLSFIASALSWYGFVLFAWAIHWCWSYQMLNYWETIIISLSILSIRYVWGLYYHKMIKYYSYIFVMGLAIVCYTLGAAILLEGACTCYYEDMYGWYDNTFSTRLIREYQLPTMCPPGPPCHVYATLAEDSSTSFFINAHTSKLHNTVSFCWQEVTTQNKKIGDSVVCATAKRFNVLKIEPTGQRYIHSAYVGDLKPDTLYEIQIYYQDENVENLSELHDFLPMDYNIVVKGYLAAIENYRTLPNNQSNRDIKIVMGGDAGYNKVSAQITKQAALVKPDVIVISGDIAYDNGLQTCYYVYDAFLDMFKPVYDQKGHLVPLVLGVGNHDVGKNSMSKAVITAHETGPLWFILFPQHSKRAEDGSLIPDVPDVSERKTYFYTKIGKLLQVTLDSGYQESYNGTQLSWWKKLNDDNDEYIKMVNYHNPIYWSIGDEVYESRLDGEQAKAGLEHWVPEIDRSRYMSAWENHQHVFKRTFPLTNGTVEHQAGTIYLGEGCWGIPPLGSGMDNTTGIFSTFANQMNHFWVVTIHSDIVTYQAVNKNGVVVDGSSQAIAPYLP